ncbi:MAG: hypothetical protein IPL41_10705 [Micropruina sp.]|nr:hypothetical protein [Micropruina sp.]
MVSTGQILRALMSADRLALIIALNPKAADVIPRGPLAVRIAASFRGGDEVALNPQPLPPKEIDLGWQAMQRVAGAAIARDGGFGGSFLSEIEEWCGTGWPRRWPKGWPVGGPQPDPRANAQVLLGALLAAAELSAYYDDREAVDALDKAVELLGEAAVQQLG